MLTVLAAELCRMGYIPTETEAVSGEVNPYEDDNTGCNGVHANKLWTCQVRM